MRRTWFTQSFPRLQADEYSFPLRSRRSGPLKSVFSTKKVTCHSLEHAQEQETAPECLPRQYFVPLQAMYAGTPQLPHLLAIFRVRLAC